MQMNSAHSALRTPQSALGRWLPDKDLNLDKQIQSLLCYRYTIGQTSASKLEYSRAESSLMKADKWINGLLDGWIAAGRGLIRSSTNPFIHLSIKPLLPLNPAC